MMNRFKTIGDNYFDWDFFWRSEKTSEKQGKLNEAGERFLADHPHLTKNIIADFRSNFPDAEISVFSPFPVEDRCLSFEVNFNSVGTFLLCVSVFNYFLVWKLHDGIPYTPESYIEKNELKLMDKVYQLVIDPNVEVDWLSKDEAYLEIKEFNYASAPFEVEEEDFDAPIHLANLLTRFR